MNDGTWKHADGTFGGGNPRHNKHGALARSTAMRMLGAVVYAAQLDDGVIKIGWTERFDLRLHWLKHYVKQDVKLLAFRVGTYEDEQALHAALAPHRAHIPEHIDSREYYDPTPEVMAVINDMRRDLGMDQLAA